MRVVVDTNVVISAILRDRRPEKVVLSEWEERFRSAIAEWPVAFSLSFPRDAKDAKFLACALAAGADFLVTGDRDFTAARQIE